jgi:hypothetical protein
MVARASRRQRRRVLSGFRRFATGFAALSPADAKDGDGRTARQHPAGMPPADPSPDCGSLRSRRCWFRLISAPKCLWGAEMAGAFQVEAASPHWRLSPSAPIGGTGEKGKKGSRGLGKRSRWSLRSGGPHRHHTSVTARHFGFPPSPACPVRDKRHKPLQIIGKCNVRLMRNLLETGQNPALWGPDSGSFPSLPGTLGSEFEPMKADRRRLVDPPARKGRSCTDFHGESPPSTLGSGSYIRKTQPGTLGYVPGTLRYGIRHLEVRNPALWGPAPGT